MRTRLWTKHFWEDGSELLLGRGWFCSLSSRSLLGLIFLALTTVGVAAESRRVLLLYDERTDLTGLATLDASIVRTFQGSRNSIEIFREAMDLSRFDSPEYRGLLGDFLREKYAGKKIDVAVPVMQPALDFLLESTNSLFASVPIVFCGIDRNVAGKRGFPPRVTGVLVKREFAPTVELVLKLHPRTERIVVVSGTSQFDRQLLRQAKAEFAPFESRVSFTYFTELPLPELLAQVSRLGPRTIVLYCTLFRDGAGTAFAPHEIAGRLSMAANVPVYGFVDQYLGRGIVGGRLYSLEAHGEAAAGLVLQILNGKSPAELPLLEPESSVTLFDWRQLQRWKINKSLLPPGSEIRFRPSNFWRDHLGTALTIGLIIALQAWIIGRLVIQSARRRRAEQDLRESEERMTQAAEAAHLGMVVWDADEPEIWTSVMWRRIHGYALDDQLSFDCLLRRVHPEDRQIVERTVKDAFANKRSFFVQHRVILPNGNVRWIAKSGRVETVGNEGRLRMVGIAMDVTERIEAEEAAREVSGRLINAQEDERRRIARDLHDDLNQRLALLSVETDLLGQMEHHAGAHPLIEDISTQVKNLSTEIHKLSYRLHPAKLEQLGLVAAARALCNEQSTLWNIVIEFVQAGVPRDLNSTAALSIYRIVQESLQNIGRHSHATQARVELTREGHELKLVVSDNGRGFDTHSVSRHAGLGLVGMRERVRLAHGHIIVHSARGKGTRIQVTVPVTLEEPNPLKL